MDLSIGNYISIIFGILAWLGISFGFFYRAKRTEEIATETKDVVKEIREIVGDQNVSHALLEQNVENHKEYCEKKEARWEGYFKDLFEKFNNHKEPKK